MRPLQQLPSADFLLSSLSSSPITTQPDKLIGYVNEYPTMHYFGLPRHTQSMIAYKTLSEYFWKFQ